MPDVSMSGISFTIVGETKNAIKAINNLKNSLRGLNRGLEDTGESAQRSGSKMRSAFGVIKKAGKTVGSTFKKSVNAVLGEATSKAISFAKGVKKITSGIGRIAMYRAFRAAIRGVTEALKEGTKNLYAWSSAVGGVFAANMNDAATSLLYFKNSLGAAWSPLMNVFAPAIRAATDAAVELLNIINQLLARLTGQSTWTRAIRKATEYGDAVGGAGEAAKEAMRYLAPFDELNVLPSDKGSGGGGGGSATDTSGMFEEVATFDEGISDFADKVKEAINSKKWDDLGTLLGTKLNDLVNSIDFKTYGAKVGEGINAWFTTKYWTLKTVNFTNIGSKIAEFLNSAMGQINFETIGKTLTQKFTNFGDIVIGAFGTVDWSLVGSSVGGLLKGAFSEASDWISGIDWEGIGDEIVTQLGNAIVKLDLSGIAESFFKFLGNAFGAASALIKGIASNIWTALKGYFGQFAEDENGDGVLDTGEKLEGLFKGLDKAWDNFKEFTRTHIWEPFWQGVKDGYYDDEEIGKNAGESFATQVLNGFKDTIDKAKKNDPLTEEEIKAISERLYEDSEPLGKKIWEGITAPFKDFKKWVEDNVLNPFIEAYNFFVSNHPKLAKALGLEEIIPEIETPSSATEQTEPIRPSPHSESTHTITVTAEAELTGFKDSIPTDEKKTLNWEIDANKFKDDIKTEDKLSKQWTANFTKRTVSTGVKAPVNVAAEMKRRIVAEGVKKPVNVSAWMKKRTVEDAVKKPINVTADYKKRIVEEGVKKPVNVTAWMKKRELSDVVKQPISTTAAIGGVSVWVKNPDGSWSEIPDIRSKARLVDKYFAPGVSDEISMTGRITKIIKPGGAIETVMKDGGALYGGRFHEIAQYASGGFPNHGSLMIAGEAGAEVVGHIGGRTEVLNQSQLAAVMYSSISNAMNGLQLRIPSFSVSGMDSKMDEDAIYRAMLRALNDSDAFPEKIDLDGEVVYRKMLHRNRLNTRMTGRNAMTAYA